MDKKSLIDMLKAEGRLASESIISAMEEVPRENFVLPEHKKYAYDDVPLPILKGQTISAPHMYAMMLELADIKKGEKVLEIGTGSGYGAALIADIVGPKQKVFSIELIPKLVKFAKENLAKSKIKNAEVIEGNGNLGLPSEAPFDKIIVTAGAPRIPEELVAQLKEGGKIVIPVGGHFQAKPEILSGHFAFARSRLYCIRNKSLRSRLFRLRLKKHSNRSWNDFTQELFVGTKKEGKLELENYGPVVFVPLVRKERTH